MKEYRVLLSISAENESDLHEQLDALDCFELDWWSESISEEWARVDKKGELIKDE